MSEFGNDTANATLRLTTKTIEELFKLLKFLMDRNDKKVDKKLKKEQLKQIKNGKDKDLAKEYLNNKRGYVRLKKLLNAGEKLIPIATPMTREQLERFNKFAKISGVPFASISNQRINEEIKEIEKELIKLVQESRTSGLTKEQIKQRDELQRKMKELNEKQQERIVIIRQKDLELVKEITDRMNAEIQLNDINKEIQSIESKGMKNLSEEEKERLSQLYKERDNMINGEFDAFNDKNNEIVMDNIINEESKVSLDFEKAVARVTDRKYAEKPCYICERTNPENYMEVISSKEINPETKKEFTNTEFIVFNDGVKQSCKEFAHGRFTHYSKKDGSNSTSYGDKHWDNMKKEMREKGGFTNDVLLFSSKESYLKYKEEFKKTQEKITPTEEHKKKNKLQEEKTTQREDTISYEADSSSFKDYMGIINRLKGQLSEHNLALNEQREVCKADTKEVIHLDKNMVDDEKMTYAEAINIGKQIDTYQKLNDCQNQIAFIRQQQELNEENFKNQGEPSNLKEMYEQMRESLHKQVYKLNMTQASLRGKINKLQNEREQLSSIKIVDMVQSRRNEDELISVQNRQHESSDKDFQNEMENVKSTLREDKHTQGKEQWSRDIQSNNNVKTDNIAEKSNTRTNEIDVEK